MNRRINNFAQVESQLLGLLFCLSVLSIFYLIRHHCDDPSRLVDLPAYVPMFSIPEDNPLSKNKIKLGRYLFYDKRLSANQRSSCGSCHIQALAFTDGQARSLGTTGELHQRGAMSLANVAYASTLNWGNPLIKQLEIQALTPLFSENPIEMGMAGKEQLIIERLSNDEHIVDMFTEAFPLQENPITISNIVKAIASFERSLLSFNSPYDQYVAGNSNALTASQKRGMRLFMGERLECFHCHGGPTFSDSLSHNNQLESEVAFHNTALYPHKSLQTSTHLGIAEITRDVKDVGKFKAPTLRNIAETAPYMHDGSMKTLEEVIEAYAQGGRAGDEHPYKSMFVSGFILDQQERQDLLNFLHALSDEEFLTNPEHSDPFQ